MALPTVGLYAETFDEFCPQKYRNQPFRCRNFNFRLASAYLECLGLKNYNPVYFNFSLTETESSKATVFPFITIFTENMLDSYLFLNPILDGKYSFITLDPIAYASKSILKSSGPEFLLHPLTVDAWMASFVAFALCGLLLWTSYKFDLIKSSKFLALFFECTWGTILLAIYASNLRAIVAVNSKTLVPFSNIDQLTELVGQKKVTLVNDDFSQTFVWNVLSGRMLINNEYPIALQKLYNSTANNPALEIKNFDHLCRRLGTDPTLVYVGRETEIEQYCSQYCFTQIDMPNIPSVHRSFTGEKHSRYGEEMNVCVDFVRAFRTIQINREKHRPLRLCKQEVQSDRINVSTFLSAFWALLVCNTLCFCLFIGERMYFRYENRLLVKQAAKIVEQVDLMKD